MSCVAVSSHHTELINSLNLTGVLIIKQRKEAMFFALPLRLRFNNGFLTKSAYRTAMFQSEAAHSDQAGAHDLLNAVWFEQADQGGELVVGAGQLQRQPQGGDVDDPRPEDFGDLDHILALMDVGAHFDEDQLALDGFLGRETFNLEDVDQLVQLLHHLVDDALVAVDHDGHARTAGLFADTDCQALDVEAAPAEQTGDLGEQAGVVVDQNGQQMLVHADPFFRGYKVGSCGEIIHSKRYGRGSASMASTAARIWSLLDRRA